MLLPIGLIKTKNRIITVKGKVIYNDRKRKIDLKRPIKDLFDPASMNIYYAMELCLCKKTAVTRIQELTDKEVLPVIMYFYKGGNELE